MAGIEVVTPQDGNGSSANPWPALAAGLVATGLAFLLFLARDVTGWFGSVPVVLRLALLGGGLLAAGAAVAIRPRSAVVLALAALAALLANLSLDAEWDSARLVLNVAVGVAAVAAVVVLLPRWARRVIVSLLIVLHFGGILSAVTSVPPPGGPAPWLSTQIWARFYRPYLQFMYLNNAYHFYSPDPGPATLLWFRVQYADGFYQWLRFPDRKHHVLAVQYQRRLSMTESTNQLVALPSVVPPNLQQVLQQIQYERMRAGERLGIPPHPHPELPLANQFREPLPYSKRMLQTYARHVAHAYPHPADPGVEVTGVKVYRVVHQIILPQPFSEGMEPYDPTLYLPYYQGEYAKDGTLKDPHEFHPDGSLKKLGDPFLYWLLPILKVPKGAREDALQSFRVNLKPQDRNLGLREYNVLDFVRRHAGDENWQLTDEEWRHLFGNP
jgi:hypothetical protein